VKKHKRKIKKAARKVYSKRAKKVYKARAKEKEDKPLAKIKKPVIKVKKIVFSKKSRGKRVSAGSRDVLDKSGHNMVKRPIVAIDLTAKAMKTKRAKKRKFSAKDKKFFKELLESIRDKINVQVSKLKSEALAHSDDVVSEDDGTEGFDKQFALSIASSENEALLYVHNALKRLENNEYGICEHCGGFIELARLKALPFATTCIICQSEMEKNRMRVSSTPSERVTTIMPEE